MISSIKRTIRTFQFWAELTAKRRVAKAYKESVKLGLFDINWYQEHYGSFSHPLRAFEDYLYKSTFSNVNPSANFDTEYYNRVNTDIYHLGMSPLIHYIYHGRFEGRRVSIAQPTWSPVNELIPEESATWRNQKIAICLHVFYPDFIQKFATCLRTFPCEVDVFVACSDQKIKIKCIDVFAKLKNVKNIEAVVAPNRGRNFGPLLVEFGTELLNYELMCHVHSKKSLYSGIEQTQWFDFLNQYLLKDKHVVKSVLRLFDKNPKLGFYYPTSFWMMPSWVNHWTCNKSFAGDFVKEWNIDITENFVNYPVGGMFWARPESIKELLLKQYSYEDFPEEPLPNDGSWLHALERAIGLLAEKNQYEQFFYYPPAGKFTKDKSHIFSNYFKHPEQLYNDVGNFEIVSFDIFDTVLRREFTEPEYAKFQLGQYLCEQEEFNSPDEFIHLRNELEFNLRKKNDFKGDVSIVDVYKELAKNLNWNEEKASYFLNLEFEYDLNQIIAKDEMVDIVNRLSDIGREIWFITDIYYTQAQIDIMLRKIGIIAPYKLFVSSELGLRKDSGTMWKHVKELLDESARSLVHVGDNVRSDAQICGDFGISNLHILHPLDKWQAAGFKPQLHSINQTKFDEQKILKWGKLVSNLGRYPFFGE